MSEKESIVKRKMSSKMDGVKNNFMPLQVAEEEYVWKYNNNFIEAIADESMTKQICNIMSNCAAV